jgi:hypothetical protein
MRRERTRPREHQPPLNQPERELVAIELPEKIVGDLGQRDAPDTGFGPVANGSCDFDRGR